MTDFCLKDISCTTHQHLHTMNAITFKSGSLLSSFQSYTTQSTYEETKEVLTKELSHSIDKIKEYLIFKDKTDEEEKRLLSRKSFMTLSDIRKAIRNREIGITQFIETLTDNQITLLYLLFQAGYDLQTGTIESYGDKYMFLYRHVDSDFNFNHTNNRQFKLSYFHDYLFTRGDAAKNVRTALKVLEVEI